MNSIDSRTVTVEITEKASVGILYKIVVKKPTFFSFGQKIIVNLLMLKILKMG